MDQFNEGDNIVDYKDDTRIPNAGTFKIKDQDHTLGNLLKDELLRDKKNVLFAGYKKPHPLEKHIEVKIQTNEDKHPIEVLRQSITAIMDVNNKLRKNFEDIMKNRAQ